MVVDGDVSTAVIGTVVMLNVKKNASRVLHMVADQGAEVDECTRVRSRRVGRDLYGERCEGLVKSVGARSPRVCLGTGWEISVIRRPLHSTATIPAHDLHRSTEDGWEVSRPL